MVYMRSYLILKALSILFIVNKEMERQKVKDGQKASPIKILVRTAMVAD